MDYVDYMADKNVCPTLGALLHWFLDREHLLAAVDDVLIDDILRPLRLIGQLEHDINHDMFDDRPQAAGARSLVERLARDGIEGALGKLERAIFHFEQRLI